MPYDTVVVTDFADLECEASAKSVAVYATREQRQIGSEQQLVNAKKFPQRQCIGCGEMKNKRELIRVVRSPEGEVSLDFGGKKNGRGAYICPNPECLKKAIRSKALDRSLEVTIPEEVYQRLEKEMENG